MTISEGKSSVTVFPLDLKEFNRHRAITVNGASLLLVRKPKLLSVLFDPLLMFADHAMEVAGKSAQNAAIRTIMGCYKMSPIDHYHADASALPVAPPIALIGQQFWWAGSQPDHHNHNRCHALRPSHRGRSHITVLNKEAIASCLSDPASLPDSRCRRKTNPPSRGRFGLLYTCDFDLGKTTLGGFFLFLYSITKWLLNGPLPLIKPARLVHILQLSRLQHLSA
ncbi:unnamed protein product [Dibothriocephalus latus]|uniref:Uncharacterized protein n=1 Tax=Dibothriocephalus latus TaxID=60516 RepID=A0A3P7LNW4_DIBLA|nr:unnamed protein product [Dibothriocephalus latus]